MIWINNKCHVPTLRNDTDDDGDGVFEATEKKYETVFIFRLTIVVNISLCDGGRSATLLFVPYLFALTQTLIFDDAVMIIYNSQMHVPLYPS